MPKILSVEFDSDNFYFVLDDGRRVGAAIKNFPLLASGTDKQRNVYTISRLGVHWPELDEDIALEPLLIQ